MPFNENWRSRRKALAGRAPVERDPADAALERAIMLARTLRWREEWEAETAARRAKTNGGGVAKEQTPRAAKPNGNVQFAAAVARTEFRRFYWDAARTEAPPQKDRTAGKRKKKDN